MRFLCLFVLTLLATIIVGGHSAKAEVIDLLCGNHIHFRIDTVNKTARAAVGKIVMDYRDGEYRNAYVAYEPGDGDTETKAHQFVKIESGKITFGDDDPRQTDFVISHNTKNTAGAEYSFVAPSRTLNCSKVSGNVVADDIEPMPAQENQQVAAATSIAPVRRLLFSKAAIVAPFRTTGRVIYLRRNGRE